MLGKILLTLVVIVVAILIIKQRNDDVSRLPGSGDSPKPAPESTKVSDFRLAAYLFLILMFGAGAIIYYLRWQDNHTVLTVNLFRDGQSAPVTYEVYKFQLDRRSFTTTDGRRIAVADSERMEIIGLDEP